MEYGRCIVIAAVLLALRMHAVYPTAPIERVAVVAIAAVRAETDDAPAALLAAIAEHESGLEPRAVSWRVRGKRVDKLWIDDATKPPVRGALACGLVSTIASTRDECAKLLDATIAMRAGAAELAEHRRARACRGSLRCALASYAGGGRGIRAWQQHRRTDATAFAELFERRASRLGMKGPTS